MQSDQQYRARHFTVSADLHRNYTVNLTENLLESGVQKLAECIGSRSGLLVTTPTVARLYGVELQRMLKSIGVSVPMVLVRCAEHSKTMRQVEQICAEAYAYDLGRKSVLIGLGGGVCTDLVTMSASLIRRGIDYLRIPTTLLGQVDAAIGIKGAVNISRKKSALGCFYPPRDVFIDPFFLKSLPVRHIISGVAEIIKVAIVYNKDLFCLLEQHLRGLVQSRFTYPHETARKVIWLSVEGMLDVLSCNLYEDNGYERLMDFGHTFSPLLEARSQFRLLHGEAVAIDIAMSIVLANTLGYLTDCDRDRGVSMLVDAGLPINSELLTEDLCIESFHDIALHRGGALNLVLPTALGSAGFIKRAAEIPASALSYALNWLASFNHPAASTNISAARYLEG